MNTTKASGSIRRILWICRGVLRCGSTSATGCSTVALAESANGDTAETRVAFEIIFSLLEHIDDECLDDIIFFADEAGSWQVGVEWNKVLPAWFKCLSATAEPELYACRIVEIVDKFDDHNRAKHLAAARRIATPAQKKALRGA